MIFQPGALHGLLSAIAFLAATAIPTGNRERTQDYSLPRASAAYEAYGERSDTCLSRMISISDACLLFYGENSRYPASLNELGAPYSHMSCRGLPFLFRSAPGVYAISCPIQSAVVTHGFIVNGTPSWPTSYRGCRSSMRVIASMCVIYYASHGFYPETVEDLGPPYSGLRCPQCLDELFIYNSYSQGQEFYIECPLPGGENHGFIDNGMASWPPW